jgi:hypothetical protein
LADLDRANAWLARWRETLHRQFTGDGATAARVRVVIGVPGRNDREAMAQLAKVRVAVGSVAADPKELAPHAPVAEASLAGAGTVTLTAGEVGPGCQQVRVVGFGPETVVALPLLPGRLGQVSLHLAPTGRLSVRQFAPPAGAPLTPPLVDALSAAQHDAESRQTLEAARTLRGVFGKGDAPAGVDLVAASLEAHLAAVNDDNGRLERVAATLTDDASTSDLPDGHVARAISLARAGRRAAANDAYRDALARGIPLLLPFFHALWDAVNLFDLPLADRDRALYEAVARRPIPEQLCTAWFPRPVRA